MTFQIVHTTLTCIILVLVSRTTMSGRKIFLKVSSLLNTNQASLFTYNFHFFPKCYLKDKKLTILGNFYNAITLNILQISRLIQASIEFEGKDLHLTYFRSSHAYAYKQNSAGNSMWCASCCISEIHI